VNGLHGKLRFDYSYSKALSTDQIQAIENVVNQEILSNKALTKKEMSIEEAKKEGALSFFGEKYTIINATRSPWVNIVVNIPPFIIV